MPTTAATAAATAIPILKTLRNKYSPPLIHHWHERLM